MTQDTGRIIVEVRAGNAEQADVGLTPGEPIEAFSVGLNGSWRIVAPGVADVHAYMYFDGATFYMASVNSADPAWVNGRPVPTEWQPLTPPCEIALGSARLWAEVEEEFDVEPDEPEPEPATRMEDARALAAPRKDARPKRPRIDPPKLDEATAISALRAPVPGPSQSVHVERRRDKVKQIKIRQSVREAPPEEESTRLAPIDVTNTSDSPHAPLPAAGRPAEPAGFAQPQPVAAPSPPMPGGYPPVAAPGPPPGGYPIPGGPPVPGPPVGGFVPPGVAAAPAPYPPQGFAGAPVPAPYPPGGAPPGLTGPGAAAFATAKTGKKSVGATIVDSWKQASIPQKAILVLMPFAIAAMFVIFDDKGKAPQRPSGTRPVASASASGPTASAVVPAASAAPTNSNAGAPPTPGEVAPPPTPPEANTALAAAPARTPSPPHRYGKEPPKSEERLAADLVAAGNYADALKAYQTLSEQHPDMPVFREAARILKEKAAQNPR